MSLGEIIAIAVIALVVGGAVAYIVKAKKSGAKCIGCPDGCACKGACGCQGCVNAQNSCASSSEKEKST